MDTEMRRYVSISFLREKEIDERLTLDSIFTGYIASYTKVFVQPAFA